MLDGLESIDWANLRHAYGAATDFPDQLRAVVEGDDDAHREAVHELFGNIYHQGTVYSATHHAVPFLVRIVTNPATRSRAEILFLLALIARGASYIAAHESLLTFDGRRDTPEHEAKKASELADVAKARDAVAAAMPTFITLLRDDDENVRATTPYVLAAYPERLGQFRDALTKQFHDETEPRVRSAILLALGDLGEMNATLYDRARRAESELERFAAAMALATAHEASCPTHVIDALVEVIRDPEPLDEEWLDLPREHSDASGDVMGVFGKMHGPAADVARARLIAVLPTIDEFRTSPTLEAVLKLTFPECSVAAPLSDLQRTVLRALVTTDAVWENRSEHYVRKAYLEAHGLPNDRDRLISLLHVS